MKDDQVIIDEFAVDLHPDLVDRQVATMYFNGVPVKVFFDTGAQRTMVTREIAQRIGLPIRRPRNPLRIRNVEDQLGSILDEVIKSTPLSSLHGDISVTVPDMLVTNSLPDCGVLAGRDLIYAVLRAVVHVDRLECFCTHQPEGTRRLERNSKSKFNAFTWVLSAVPHIRTDEHTAPGFDPRRAHGASQFVQSDTYLPVYLPTCLP
jgi:hypothetical protein